jgi:hypothetical protein
MANKSTIRALGLSMVVLAFATSSLAAVAEQQPDSQTTRGVRDSDHKSGFGRPESITGRISMVKPDEGLLIVEEQGAGQSTNVSGAAVVTQNTDGTKTTADTDVSAAPGPAEAEYHFRVTANTLILVNGQKATLNDLAGMQDKQVTIHFVPERNGNFVKGIEVGPSS